MSKKSTKEVKKKKRRQANERQIKKKVEAEIKVQKELEQTLEKIIEPEKSNKEIEHKKVNKNVSTKKKPVQTKSRNVSGTKQQPRPKQEVKVAPETKVKQEPKIEQEQRTKQEPKVSEKKQAPKSGEKKKKETKSYRGKKLIIAFLILTILGSSSGLFLLYGPWSGFRDWLITTAMASMNHRYLATWFYSDKYIQECLDRNKVIEVAGPTDLSMINIPKATQENVDNKEIVYANEYEREILERDKKNNDYKIIKIDGGYNYEGYMAVIYDPSRVEVATSKYIGSSGQYLTDISKQNDALVAINGGGFLDIGGSGSGASALGVTMSRGRVISSHPSNYGVIGFDTSHRLVLDWLGYYEMQDMGIRDSVSFGPVLMKNGERSQISGNGGWGTAPRTAIGQRADGIVLFLVLDGNRVLGKGATIKDMIDIFERYGAVNASNLDGGTSTSMTVHGKTVNNPTDLSGRGNTRPVPSAFILRADDSDDGDYSVVQDKVDD